MKPVLQNALCAVFDDFLPPSEWQALWNHFQTVKLGPVNTLGQAWRYEDGQPLSGSTSAALAPNVDLRDEHNERIRLVPSDTPLAPFLRRVMAVSQKVPHLVGQPGKDWELVSATPFVYGVGSALAWHQDDNVGKCGAYIYYAHPRWNIAWGGELLISDPPPGRRTARRKKRPDTRFDNEPYSELLQQRGAGMFVLPKSNRLVFVGSADHSITPVRKAAGSNVRASLAGFFVRDATETLTGGTKG